MLCCIVWKFSQGIILIYLSWNWLELSSCHGYWSSVILPIAETSINLSGVCLPGSEPTDCVFAKESRSFNLSSAAESRPLWLSATDAPPDSRAAICRQNNTGLRHRLSLLRWPLPPGPGRGSHPLLQRLQLLLVPLVLLVKTLSQLLFFLHKVNFSEGQKQEMLNVFFLSKNK